MKTDINVKSAMVIMVFATHVHVSIKWVDLGKERDRFSIYPAKRDNILSFSSALQIQSYIARTVCVLCLQ